MSPRAMSTSASPRRSRRRVLRRTALGHRPASMRTGAGRTGHGAMCRRGRRSVDDRRWRVTRRGALSAQAEFELELPALGFEDRVAAFFAKLDRLVDRSLRPLQEFAGLFAVWLGHDAHSRSGGSTNHL